MNPLLLDTCTFVWLVALPASLSARAKRALSRPGAELMLSDASLWEISLKWRAGKLVLPDPPRLWVEEQVKVWRLSRLSIDRDDLYRVSELEERHRDPFDRLLVAQAMARGLTIVTPDAAVRAYPVSTVW